MPRGSDLTNLPLRELLYGEPKTRKTWWAVAAAESGFNVLLFDGDDGAHIVKKLSPAAQKRVRVVRCMDTAQHPLFIQVITRFMAGETVVWDDTAGQLISALAKPKEDHVIWELKLARATNTDVIITDSHTSLVTSLAWQYMMEQGQDVKDAKKQDWDAYAYAGRLVEWMHSCMHKVPCHYVHIAHEVIVDMTKKEPGGLDPKTGKTIVNAVPTGEQYKRIVSSSKANAATLGRHFSDILWFHKVANKVYIDTRAEEGREGGSRNVFKDDEWDKLQFDTFVKSTGMIIPGKDAPDIPMPLCLEFTGEEYVAYKEKSLADAKARNTGTATTIKPGAALQQQKPNNPLLTTLGKKN